MAASTARGTMMKSVAVQIIDTTRTKFCQIGIIPVYCDRRTAVQTIANAVELELKQMYDVTEVQVYESPVKCNPNDGTLKRWKSIFERANQPVEQVPPTDSFLINTADGLPLSQWTDAREITPRVWDTIEPDLYGDLVVGPGDDTQGDIMVHVRALVKRGKRIGVQIIDTSGHTQRGCEFVMCGRHGAVQAIAKQVKRPFEYIRECTVNSVQVFQSPVRFDIFDASKRIESSPPTEEFNDPERGGASISPLLWDRIASTRDSYHSLKMVWVRVLITLGPEIQDVGDPQDNHRRRAAAFSDM